MGNLLHLALWHMAAGAIIGRGLRSSDLERQATAFFRVASETLGAKVADGLPCARLDMWIVASEATELAAAFTEAAAGLHSGVML